MPAKEDIGFVKGLGYTFKIPHKTIQVIRSDKIGEK